MSDGKRDGDGVIPLLAAGWAYAGGSRKAHYFPQGETMRLCRKVGFYRGPRENSQHDSPDNCASCKKAYKANYTDVT